MGIGMLDLGGGREREENKQEEVHRSCAAMASSYCTPYNLFCVAWCLWPK